MNGKLVIRVGGGYMVIEEFIANYADQELARCKFVEANQMIENNEGNNERRNSGNLKKGGSPRGSPRPGSGNGGHRSSIANK